MLLTSWGKYPKVESDVFVPADENNAAEIIRNSKYPTMIPRGLGRSYGDSALASAVMSSKNLDRYDCFDSSTGLLKCSAGVSLEDILRVFVPKGWFLPVTPGTKYVSVGGAVASDVHGKNHHVEGSFCDHVSEMTIITALSGAVTCSRESYPELFYATCGGMGLTGFIINVTFKLKKIKSALINEKVIKAENLEEAIELFEEYKNATYSVAWIDCLSTGRSMGRSLIMLGEHAGEGELSIAPDRKIVVPFDMPGLALNRYTVQLFNSLYYNRVRKHETERITHYEPFFYPLDSLLEWNRIYGKSGFTQYQFVLPLETGLEGISRVLKEIAESKLGSFLAVLKIFGDGNENYLSFPMKGYTLALDFKMCDQVRSLMLKLDDIVLDLGGRIYLSKDVRMSERIFKAGYPDWMQFQEVREKYGAPEVFNSIQSTRIGL
jgi:FAD/FMN-containing dehydrogenase